MATDYKMPRRGERCFASGQPFEIGAPLIAVLRETDAGYERRDYAPDHAPDALDGEVARWRTRRPEPRQAPSQPFDRAAIFAFFKRLGQDDRPSGRQLRFVLALLLWRKKVLNLDTTETTDTGERWRFSVVGSDDAVTYDVLRPELDDDQVEQLGRQLEVLLSDQQAAFSLVGDEAPETDDAE